MDFSSCINFDDLEDKVLVAKPKFTIKNQVVHNAVIREIKLNEKDSERSKSFYSGESSICVRPIINFPVFNKTGKESRTRKEYRPYKGQSGLSEKKTMIGNLGQLSIADEKSSSISRRQNNKNLRRLKWHRLKLRSKSCISSDMDLIGAEKCSTSNDKKQIIIRRKSISNNKPCIFQGKKQEKPELRIQGVSKDPEIKPKSFLNSL